jgi:hypothetical protein
MFCANCGAQRGDAAFCSNCGLGFPQGVEDVPAKSTQPRKSNVLLLTVLSLVIASGSVATTFYLVSQNNGGVVAEPSETLSETDDPETEPEVSAYSGPTLELTKRQLKYGFEMITSTDEVTANSAAFRYASDTDLQYWGCSSGESCGLVFVTADATCEIIELAYTEIRGSREWLLSVSGPTVDESGLYEPGYGAPVEVPLPHNGDSYRIDDSICR